MLRSISRPSRSSWALHLRQVRRQVDNARLAIGAKIELRQKVLTEIGAANAHVFDAFAGEGHLYRQVWRQAASYVGCDMKWIRDERLMFVGDSRRVMRAIDLSHFTIVDLDAYGSPWEHVAILAARRRLAPGERLGLVLTDGTSLYLRMSGLPLGLRDLTGFLPVPGLVRRIDDLLNRAIAETARRLRATIVKRWEARGRTQALIRYTALVFEGRAG